MWGFWILVVIGFALLIYSWTCKDYEYNGLVGMIGVILILIAMAISDAHIKEPQPTAIEVYRGKTELEYTIRGGEVVDSVVVYKKISHGREN